MNLSYTRLVTSLRKFLQPYYISINTTDVFEEVLLQLAQVTHKPIKSQFCPVGEDKVGFKIQGIENEDAEKFLSFLKTNCEDDDVHKEIYKADLEKGEEDKIYEGAYFFTVNADKFIERVLPLFEKELQAIHTNSPEVLLPYQQQSEDNKSIKEFKLSQKILKLMAEGETSMADPFTQGELHIIFWNIRDTNQNLWLIKDAACINEFEVYMSFFNDLVKHIQQLDKVMADNDYVKNSETCQELKACLEEYAVLLKPIIYIDVSNFFIRRANSESSSIASAITSRITSTFGSVVNFFQNVLHHTPAQSPTHSDTEEEDYQPSRPIL